MVVKETDENKVFYSYGAFKINFGDIVNFLVKLNKTFCLINSACIVTGGICILGFVM